MSAMRVAPSSPMWTLRPIGVGHVLPVARGDHLAGHRAAGLARLRRELAGEGLAGDDVLDEAELLEVDAAVRGLPQLMPVLVGLEIVLDVGVAAVLGLRALGHEDGLAVAGLVLELLQGRVDTPWMTRLLRRKARIGVLGEVRAARARAE